MSYLWPVLQSGTRNWTNIEIFSIVISDHQVESDMGRQQNSFMLSTELHWDRTASLMAKVRVTGSDEISLHDSNLWYEISPAKAN